MIFASLSTYHELLFTNLKEPHTMKTTIKFMLLLGFLALLYTPIASAQGSGRQYFTPQENHALMSLGLGPSQYNYGDRMQFLSLQEIVRTHKTYRSKQVNGSLLLITGLLFTTVGVGGMILAIQFDNYSSPFFAGVSLIPLSIGIGSNVLAGKLFKRAKSTKQQRDQLITGFRTSYGM